MAAAVAASTTPAPSSSEGLSEAGARPDLDPIPRCRIAFIFATLVLAAVGSVAWMLYLPPSLDGADALLLVTLGIATVVAIRTPLAVGHITASSETIPLVACALLAPDLLVPMALATAFLVPGVTTSVRAMCGAQVVAATVASVAVSSIVFDPASTSPSAYALGALVAAGTFHLACSGLTFAYEVLVWREPARRLIPQIAGSTLATTVFALPVICVIVYSVSMFSVLALPMLLLPLAMTQYFHGLYHRKLQLTEELADKAQILARTNLQFAAAMVRALDTRDAYTAGHSAAVAVYTRDIAREMGFNDETVRLAHLAGLLHDIGKIGVPGRVLNKQSPLDDEEYELMKTHAGMGAEILGEVDLYKDIAILVRYHHERIDGRGYPDQLEGEAIPAISRMISVADTYSAMTTDRPYRDGMPTEKAMSILQECRGTQLDADFTNAFLRILIVADAAYQRGKQTDFEVEVAKHQALSEVEAEAVRIHAPTPAGPHAPAAPDVPTLPVAVDGELVEVELEREAA